MKIIRWTFLYKLYETDKWLFAVLVAFISMQLLFTVKGVETLPFFNYGMYSAQQLPQQEYHTIAITWNDAATDLSQVHTLPVDYLSSILAHYAMLKQERFHDPIDETIQHRFKGITGAASNQMITGKLENTPIDEALFYNWLCRYLHSFSEEPINNFQITDRSYEWENGKFTPADETIIYSYSCNP